MRSAARRTSSMVMGQVTSRSLGVELLQRLLRMLRRLDLAVRALDATVGADEIGDARRRIDAGVGRRAVRDSDLLVGVAQQRKVEIVFLGELPVRFDGIEADAVDLNIVLLELLGSITEP